MTKNQQVEEKKNVLDKAAIKEPYVPGAAFGLSQSLGVERLQKGQYQERY
jgi:hypothetical protein